MWLIVVAQSEPGPQVLLEFGFLDCGNQLGINSFLHFLFLGLFFLVGLFLGARQLIFHLKEPSWHFLELFSSTYFFEVVITNVGLDRRNIDTGGSGNNH